MSHENIICPLTDDLIDIYVEYIEFGEVEDSTADLIFQISKHCSECKDCEKAVNDALNFYYAINNLTISNLKKANPMVLQSTAITKLIEGLKRWIVHIYEYPEGMGAQKLLSGAYSTKGSGTKQSDDEAEFDIDDDDTLKITFNILLQENQQVYLKDKDGTRYPGIKETDGNSTVVDFGEISEIGDYVIEIEYQ